MNNITPIRQPPVVSAQDWWSPHPSHPIWPPQDGCPPQPCPTPPSCFSAVSKADACWDQSQSLYNLVSKVVMDIFTKNPGIIPPPPPSTGSGPILGVTDGSYAAPGQVGELVSTTVEGTFPNTPLQQAVSTVVLQPGDWDVNASLLCVVALTTGVYFYLNPAPAGFTSNMFSVSGAFTTATLGPDEVSNSLVTPTIQANIKVPSLIAFTLYTNYAGASSGQPQGTFFLNVYCRRRR